MSNTFSVTSVEETEAIGRQIAKKLEEEGTRVKFIALFGEMGVGKTAFTRGFCSAFGIARVKSPTYTVVNEYRGSRTVYHFDFYRLGDADGLYSIGYDDYISSGNLCIAEWCELIPDDLPPHRINITIRRTDNGDGREIEVSEQ